MLAVALRSLVIVLGAACQGEQERPPAPRADAGPVADATADAETAPDAAGGDAGRPLGDDCTLGPGPGCTCVLEPSDVDRACWHSFGGRYAAGACSASYQCCDGRWAEGAGSCGACSCVEETGALGCVPEVDGLEVCFPTFTATVEPLPEAVRARMAGSSFHDGCPVSLDELSLLHLPYFDFDGVRREGELVVATRVATDVVEVFRRLHDARFVVRRMVLVDEYGGSDDLAMADDDTSAFNCRFVEGTDTPSQHSYGTAIDLNPLENPYVRGDTVLPPEGARYVDRSLGEPGMIVAPGPVTAAFSSIGWGWGGTWQSLQDYQHFSESGN